MIKKKKVNFAEIYLANFAKNVIFKSIFVVNVIKCFSEK